MNHRRFFVVLLVLSASFASAKPVRLSEVMEHFGCDVNPPKSDHKCHFLKRGIIRDSRACLADPKRVMELADLGVLSLDWKEVRGSIRYVGFYPGSYRYWVRRNLGGEVEIKASIHFSNLRQFSSKEIENFKAKIKSSALKWNKYYGDWGKVRFIFSLATKARQASIANVRLIKDSTRGPYFSKWSLKWSQSVIAHEFGHILGLDDEYKNGLGGGDGSVCSRSSRMCSTGGRSQDYHYYLMLRRADC